LSALLSPCVASLHSTTEFVLLFALKLSANYQRDCQKGKMLDHLTANVELEWQAQVEDDRHRLPCFINTTLENSFIPDGVASTV
jgi:hypothetical protein